MAEEQVEDQSQEIAEKLTRPAVDPGKLTPPPLKPGDRLTREEFERRYDAMPHLKKAELIQGVVYMPSPVRADIHGKPHARMTAWLGVYCAATSGTDFADNATVRLDANNEPQPDAMMWIESGARRNSHVGDDGYIEGAPELVVEIAGTSADYDLHEKLEVYLRADVKEYVVWQTQDERIDWFQLSGTQYVLLTPHASGVIHSEVFRFAPGG